MDQPLNKELKKLRQKHKLLATLATQSGFIDYYFKQLKNFQTQKETFDHINELYHTMTGEYKYASWKSFQIIKNRRLKK